MKSQLNNLWLENRLLCPIYSLSGPFSKTVREKWICLPCASIVNPAIPEVRGFSMRSNSRVSRLNMSFSENRPTFPAHAPAPLKPRERDRHGTSASGRGIFASRRAADAVQAASPTDAAPLPPLPDLPPREVLFLSLLDPQYSDFLAAGNSHTLFSPEFT
jgi:hypothetical protein